MSENYFKILEINKIIRKFLFRSSEKIQKMELKSVIFNLRIPSTIGKMARPEKLNRFLKNKDSSKIYIPIKG